eukprot:TRINITY_DN97774_c0_g1_i1.p1 TRINITY_DN97774_c0_g1~~TRINITY_DN97774_c0_g1_i1.p1  ORF type:complete len:234 (-),score=50.12 TRINITY_DN97774_c0_g1_i1:45-725(-)
MDSGFSTPYSGALDAKPADLAFMQQASATFPKLVLDVGCGPDVQAASFLSGRKRPCAPILFCLDVHRRAVEQGAAKLGPRAEGIVADMCHLRRVLRDGVFDLVLCFYALQHTHAPLQACSSFVELTSPGGAVAVAALCDQMASVAADGEGEPQKLPPPLFNCYKSWLEPGVLSQEFRKRDCRLQWASARHEAHAEIGEFPCVRNYAVAVIPKVDDGAEEARAFVHI